MTLADRRSRCDADHHIGEVLASRAPQAKPSQLDRWLEASYCTPGDAGRVVRGTVHEHVDISSCQAHCGSDDQHRDEERRDRVAIREPCATASEPGEHCERSGEIAREVERVREQRVALVPARPSERDGGT